MSTKYDTLREINVYLMVRSTNRGKQQLTFKERMHIGYYKMDAHVCCFRWFLVFLGYFKLCLGLFHKLAFIFARVRFGLCEQCFYFSQPNEPWKTYFLHVSTFVFPLMQSSIFLRVQAWSWPL